MAASKGPAAYNAVSGVTSYLQKNNGAAEFQGVGTTDLEADALVFFSALPTADPHAEGQLWANSGVVTVSAG